MEGERGVRVMREREVYHAYAGKTFELLVVRHELGRVHVLG
jgi:hypothetical protein